MSSVKCPWCGEENSAIEELFIHNDEIVDTECSSCGNKISVTQIIDVRYEISRTGHNDDGLGWFNNGYYCSNCYQKIKDTPHYHCSECENVVCESCREEIKKRYPGCYENMTLRSPEVKSDEI